VWHLMESVVQADWTCNRRANRHRVSVFSRIRQFPVVRVTGCLKRAGSLFRTKTLVFQLWQGPKKTPDPFHRHLTVMLRQSTGVCSRRRVVRLVTTNPKRVTFRNATTRGTLLVRSLKRPTEMAFLRGIPFSRVRLPIYDKGTFRNTFGTLLSDSG